MLCIKMRQYLEKKRNINYKNNNFISTKTQNTLGQNNKTEPESPPYSSEHYTRICLQRLAIEQDELGRRLLGVSLRHPSEYLCPNNCESYLCFTRQFKLKKLCYTVRSDEHRAQICRSDLYTNIYISPKISNEDDVGGSPYTGTDTLSRQ